MLSRLFGARVTVAVRILGQVGGQMVRWEGEVRVKAPASIKTVLEAAGRAAGVDLTAALQAGDQPAVLLNGRRLELPADLAAPVADGARVAWLMPMAGG